MPAPRNPAPASGPGALSRRTDGGPAQKLQRLSGAAYGEQKIYQSDQRGAPMAQTPGPSARPGPPPSAYRSALAAVGMLPEAQPQDPSMSFQAPSQRPLEPVTAGSATGPGAGPEALGISPAQLNDRTVSRLRQYLPFLEFQANLPATDDGARQLVRYVKGMQPSDVSAAQPARPAAGQPAAQGGG